MVTIVNLESGKTLRKWRKMAGWGFAGESVIHLYNFCDVRLGLTYHILFLMKAKKASDLGLHCVNNENRQLTRV